MCLKIRLKNKCKCDRSEDDEDGADPTSNLKKPTNEESEKKHENPEYLTVEGNDENQLTRTSCHDSGIDIRDALPTKKVQK